MKQCSRKGVVERDGKWYCKVHDPIAVDKRRTDRYNKVSQKIQNSRREFLNLQLTPELLKVCKDLLAIVKLQNGNLHEDTNKIIKEAEDTISKIDRI